MTNLQSLKNYLIDICEYPEEKVESMTKSELFNARLQWEGIQGFSSDILYWVETIYHIDLGEEYFYIPSCNGEYTLANRMPHGYPYINYTECDIEMHWGPENKYIENYCGYTKIPVGRVDEYLECNLATFQIMIHTNEIGADDDFFDYIPDWISQFRMLAALRGKENFLNYMDRLSVICQEYIDKYGDEEDCWSTYLGKFANSDTEFYQNCLLEVQTFEKYL